MAKRLRMTLLPKDPNYIPRRDNGIIINTRDRVSSLTCLVGLKCLCLVLLCIKIEIFPPVSFASLWPVLTAAVLGINSFSSGDTKMVLQFLHVNRKLGSPFFQKESATS